MKCYIRGFSIVDGDNEIMKYTILEWIVRIMLVTSAPEVEAMLYFGPSNRANNI